MSNKTSISSDNNSYDQVPYESFPYALTHPLHLKTIGSLFGMTPVDPSKAKVLELGCAAGGNIIPLALKYPKAHFVGVDLSEVQIKEGQKHIKALGIKNLDLKCVSIADIDKSYGTFDYIICHGVLSWVPENVSSAIFDICSSSLSPNGMAYISYNTLPGWNMVRSIRDMMLYHSNMFSDKGHKVQQARLLLDFVKDSLAETKTPYAEFLKSEATLLAQQPDAYILHEHLEENNRQFYFHEFMEEASKRSLQYVGDTNLASMFMGNLPAKVVEKLQAVTDIVRSEQYMDFINNRRFRGTILCHNKVSLNRSLQMESIKNFFMHMRIIPAKPISEIDLNDSTNVVDFYLNGNKDTPISTSSPGMKAVLYAFAENFNHPLDVDELAKIATAKLKNANKENIILEIINNAMRLVLSGYINISSDKPQHINKIESKPKASELVRYQAEHTNAMWVTTELHDRVVIGVLEKYALRYMDGKHTKESIIDKLVEHVKKGEIVMTREGASITEDKAIKKELLEALNLSLERLKVSAIFV